MGSGRWTKESFVSYSAMLGRSYAEDTGRVSGQTYKARKIDKSLDPREFTVRECVNTEEHPNTIPVILALDVTGSMGEACSETAAALGVIVSNLYDKITDVEFCVMGIGDLAYDDAPVQMSQFESDIRIAEALDKIYMEHGGGGNRFESYTAAWYMGLKRTKLDCYDLQGRKGIIITMGDEPLNPYLPYNELNSDTNAKEQADIETGNLYVQASEKFDIFHIAVDSPQDCYAHYKEDIEKSFGQILGSNLKVATINNLAQVIEECIMTSVNGTSATPTNGTTATNENGEICW
jgi:hypothetical protein